MKKRQFIILILLLVIGFASVSTTLILNGKVGLGVELDDYDVIFIEALLNGEENEKAIISADKKTITFTTERLSNKGDTARLDYKVKNNSTQYDADVTINCTNDKSEYVTVTSEFDGKSIPLESLVNMKVQEVKSGYVNAELSKAYAGEDTSIEITCKIVFTATSSDTYAYSINFDSNGGSKVEDKVIILDNAYGELETPEREGYVFLGWFDDNDVKVDETTIFDTKGNKILYAKWTPACSYNVGQVWNFNYTGGEQVFNTPCLANYKIEVWGAQGGASNATYIGGYGGYSTGVVTLDYDTNMYINVGGMGATNSTAYSSVGAKGGYNGGGTANPLSTVNHLYGAGGGATHVALQSGVLSTLANAIDKILIVAGGGGGGRWQSNYTAGSYGYGGHGGGYIGVRSSVATGTQNGPIAGSQSYVSGAGTFGQGANNTGGSAGGGGFYGGGSGTVGAGPASGGSGYIGNPLLYDKVMYCYNCATSNDEATKTISTTSVNASAISNYAKSGHGYARITLVSFPY